MPTKYQRKLRAERGAWTEENLRQAIEAITNGTMGVNEASRNFNIPKATLLRRKNSNNLRKTGSLGPACTLGDQVEQKLVAHIKKLQKFGFAPTRSDVRYMAFALAEQLKIKHRFNTVIKMAGIRTAEGVSVARSTALNRETVNSYFALLETVLTENQLFDKPGNIFNIDETGLQLNNKPGHVIAAKGSKSVSSITSGEKGETISLIACCNGEGTFIPPYCIFKGKNVKDEYSSGMPPGSVVRMSQKSAYVNTEIFFNWLKEHFLPRKPMGKVLLILDGHTSHCNLCEMLEFADEHGIIILCLPPHTTHYLQPLDRAVFKSLKSHYYEACNNYIKTNTNKKIGRLQFGQLLAQAWSKSAVASNAISGFKATGIIPFSPDAIPEYAFIEVNPEPSEQPLPAEQSKVYIAFYFLKYLGLNKENMSPNSQSSHRINEHSHSTPVKMNMELVDIDNSIRQPSCSHWSGNKSTDEPTPGKMLDKINPVPKGLTQHAKKRGRTGGTSPDNIAIRKAKSKKIEKREPIKKTKKKISKNIKNRKTKMGESINKKRQSWQEDDMKSALEEVRNKQMGWKRAAKTYNVPASTLRRRFHQKNRFATASSKGFLGGKRPTFSKELEEILVSHLRDLEVRFFGLNMVELRRLAFDIAESNHLPHPFNKTKKMAGWDWVHGFLKRNPSISLRLPEKTSLARAQAFNKPKIKEFFSILTKVIDDNNLSPNQIWNVDESGFSTVHSKSAKIFATKGRKQVGILSSAERGNHFTAICSMNAIGTYVPPAIIYPRKKMKQDLLDHALPGCLGLCQENGWVNGDLFLKWLIHFNDFVKPSLTSKVLLIVDGHGSHKNLPVLEFAKRNGIILFCLPPHTTHRLQPLDVSVYGPLTIYYDQEIQKWLRSNPGRAVTHTQVGELFFNAYKKAATIENALSGFSKTGIQPLNMDIFPDYVFAAAETTNIVHQNEENDLPNEVVEVKAPAGEIASSSKVSSKLSNSPNSDQNKMSKFKESLLQISPMPIAPAPQDGLRKKRKRGTTGVLNTSPAITAAQLAEAEKKEKERRKTLRKKHETVRSLFDNSEDEEEVEIFESDHESDAACLYCNELFSISKKGEHWIRCQKCNSWCHTECAGVDRKIKVFKCELCI
ncbi:hypothetical protein PPYR_00106 [Photinus pyralis]|uniref:HTH psq-type domain-containing protein n=1 Tax=Photinus pyralis TaxID=7054 RepID=A0A5N4B0P8_PHOPY|nr:hypothetical protein PPYR_00106 [Photinus pyralis]